ncbi:MAG: maleylpyruvate isomerase N-terminal domain-containing protein [Streptosporangiaceae bacterium]
MPEHGWQAPKPCAEWTVAQVLRHALGDQKAYAGVLTGTGFPDQTRSPRPAN